MQRKDILLQGWDFTYDIEGWYPPLKDALQDVDHEMASCKAEGRASNTIGELVNHLLYYKKRFLYRLENRTWPVKINTNDDTFFIEDYSTPSNWKNLTQELASVHNGIREKLAHLKDEDLDAARPNDPVDRQILDLILHDAYHTGQIILIRKLYGSWPEYRNP